MVDSIRIGVVGAGANTRLHHIPKLAKIEGVEIVALIEQRPDGTVKASLRAKDTAMRVDLVAAEFTGGGHACAEGLNLNTGTENVSARLIASLAKRTALVDATRTTQDRLG